MSQAGFPSRIPFSELLSRYALLLPSASRDVEARAGRASRARSSPNPIALKELSDDHEPQPGLVRVSSVQMEQQQLAMTLLKSLKVRGLCQRPLDRLDGSFAA